MTKSNLSVGEQLIIALLWNWQLCFNKKTDNSDFAITMGKKLNRIEPFIHKLITHPEIRKIIDHPFEEYEKLFETELKEYDI